MSKTTCFSDADYDGKGYASFRPNYPSSLYERIYNYHESHGGQFHRAVDLACGSGQATIPLTKKFKEVIGIDSSEAQLKAACQKDIVEYRIGTAEHIPCEDHTVDLLTVAQAAHWFDMNAFYQEAERILKKKGSLALWCYNLCQVVNEPQLSGLVNEFYNDTLNGYWDERRRIIENNYADIHLFKNTERIEMIMTHSVTIQHLLNYLKTWSAYKNFRDCNNEKEDPVDKMGQDIQWNLGRKLGDTVQLSFPIALLLSHMSEQ